MWFSSSSDRVTGRFLDLGREPLEAILEVWAATPLEELGEDIEGESCSCLGKRLEKLSIYAHRTKAT